MFEPRVRGVRLNLPESGNGIPDILNEVRWNLDWMLSMQDEDGGVWHKQTSEQFCPFVMPEKDRLVSFVIGAGQEPFKTSCATGDLAAVAAIAARVYKPLDLVYSEKCLRAARLGFEWLEKHPNVTFRNPPGVATGEYRDANCGDDSEAAGAIRRDSVSAADQIVTRSAANGYRISLTSRDYIWGSNGVAANYGMQLLVANAIQANPRYVETALENLHYLLGRNTFSLSFVTRVGDNPFRHPHHRPSGAGQNAEPWPGLLSGGPNRGRQDPAMRDLQKLPADLPPAKAYLDDRESYASNEVAINWNAPLVFLLAGALAGK